MAAVDADADRHLDLLRYVARDTDISEEDSNHPNSSRNDLITLHDDNYSNSGSHRNTHILASKIREESLEICSLLPQFGYHFIYNMLHKNQWAENRVELVLWDILPYKRPNAKWTPTNKYTGNNFKKKSIAPIKIVEKEWNLIKKNVTAVDRSSPSSLRNRPEKTNSTSVSYKRNVSSKYAFMPNSTNNTTIQKRNLLHDYLQYLKYMKQNKWMKLSGSTKPNRNISQPINKNQVRGVVDMDEDCDSDAGNDFDDTRDTCKHVKLSDTAEPQDVQQIALSNETDDLDSVSSDINDPLAKLKLEDMLESSSKRDGNTHEVANPSVQSSKKNHYTAQDQKLQKSQTDIGQGSQKEVEDRYTYLSGVFPEADPTYLTKVVQRMPDDPNAVNQFIEKQWENPTYLTKKEKEDRLHITIQQTQYNVAFDMEQFLKIFPDPFKQYEHPGRKCTKNPDAILFLKSRFALFRSTTITRLYQKHNYNLCLTAQELEYTFPDRKTARTGCSWGKHASNDIPLLQECAFIKHKSKIRAHLDKLKEEEAKEFEKLKERNELLECQCCYNNECMPSKCSSCRDGHVFCNSCIIEGTESMLAQGVTSITCFTNCDYDFSLPTLQNILTPTQFSALIRKKQEVEVMAAGLDGLVSCPFCHFASIPPPDDKVFKCFNPECMKESCPFCKELNHVPLECNEKSENARLFLEEKMTEAYVRKCHKCQVPYVKTSGCNKISCSCGALMCYLCDKPVFSYQHFAMGECPLYSNDQEINETTVQAVAKKTVEFIQAKDPKIKMDARMIKVLQNNPPASVNNSAVLNRVNKVAEFSNYKHA